MCIFAARVQHVNIMPGPAFAGYVIKGVVYASRPRAEVEGAAFFTDAVHSLRAVVRFGPNKGAQAQVMR